MSAELPARVSLEYLKKLAKERLTELRVYDPAAKLAAAQLDVARRHGFPSWRALRAEIDRRRAPLVLEFAQACAAGDIDTMGVIGWAARKGNEQVVDLLLARGARHHIFSAMALGDQRLVERLVADDPACLLRRRSRFENGQTPVHAAFAPPDGLGFLAGGPDHAMLALLIDLGADVYAADGRGRMPLDIALLRGDAEASRLLEQAGATRSASERRSSDDARDLSALAASVKKSEPMFRVKDMRASVRWYQSIGFTLVFAYDDGGEMIFARLSFGGCEFTLSPGTDVGPRDVSLWLYTDRVAEIYDRLKARQIAAVSGSQTSGDQQIRFEEDLHTPFYGGRQFSMRDINGLALVFLQPDGKAPSDD